MGRPRSPRGRARVVRARLAEEYPGSPVELCELTHRNPFELLVATILSAQTTDVGVNAVTPVLFERYPTPADLGSADPETLEGIIRTTGFYRNKAKSLIGMARALTERYGGEVPPAMADLVTVPGVGRKTANVVRSVAMDRDGLPVDTHVLRLSRRLGLVDPDVPNDPEKVEAALNAVVPPRERGLLSLRLIRHGRRVCQARRPACDACVLQDVCPSAGTFGPPAPPAGP